MCMYNPRNYVIKIWESKGGKNPPVICREKNPQMYSSSSQFIPGSLTIKALLSTTCLINTNIYKDRQRDRQTGRLTTNRQTDRKRERERQTDFVVFT
jgi:hypothetical protein